MFRNRAISLTARMTALAIVTLALVACNRQPEAPQPQLVPTRTLAPRPTATAPTSGGVQPRSTPTMSPALLTGLTLENADRLVRIFEMDEPPPRHIYSVTSDRLVIFTSRSFEIIAADMLDVRSRTSIRLNDEAAPVFWYAASPNGRVGAVMQLDGTIDIYDLDTSQVITTIIVPKPSTEIPSDIALNEDGSELVVVSRGELRRVRLADAKIIGERQTLPPTTQAIRFSEDASRVAAVQPTGDIVIINAISGAPPITLTGVFTNAAIEHLSFSPNGMKFGASGGETLAIWDLSGDQPVLQKTFDELGGTVEPVFDRSGRFMAVLISPMVLLYDLEADEPKTQFRLSGNLPVWSANFDSSAERLFLAGSGDLASFDIAANRALESATRPPLTRSAFSADGETLFTWSAVYPSNDVAIFDTEAWEVRGRLLHDAPVAWVAPDRANTYVATITLDRRLQVWRVRDGRPLVSIAAPTIGAFRALLCFAPDNRSLVYLEDQRIVLHDIATDREANDFALPFEPRLISGCDSETGVFAMADDQDIRVFDLDGRTVAMIERVPDLEDAGAIYLSSDGSKLAMLTPERLAIWDVQTQEVLHAIRLSRAPRGGVFSFPGDRFAINFGDAVEVLDVASGERVSLDLPKGSNAAVFFARDPRLIITALMIPTPETAGQSLDRRIFASGALSLWDAQTGRLLRRVEMRDPPYAGTVSNDGAFIVTHTRMNAMTVWGLSPAR